MAHELPCLPACNSLITNKKFNLLPADADRLATRPILLSIYGVFATNQPFKKLLPNALCAALCLTSFPAYSFSLLDYMEMGLRAVNEQGSKAYNNVTNQFLSTVKADVEIVAEGLLNDFLNPNSSTYIIDVVDRVVPKNPREKGLTHNPASYLDGWTAVGGPLSTFETGMNVVNFAKDVKALGVDTKKFDKAAKELGERIAKGEDGVMEVLASLYYGGKVLKDVKDVGGDVVDFVDNAVSKIKSESDTKKLINLLIAKSAVHTSNELIKIKDDNPLLWKRLVVQEAAIDYLIDQKGKTSTDIAGYDVYRAEFVDGFWNNSYKEVKGQFGDVFATDDLVAVNLNNTNIVVHTGNNGDTSKNKDESVTLPPSKDESGEKIDVTQAKVGKSKIESLAHDQLALEKTIKEKEQAISQLPAGSTEERDRLIAQLEKLKVDRLYLDFAENAIKGRTGKPHDVFAQMNGAEQKKLEIATKQLLGISGTPTEADMIRMIAEFYVRNSGNRTELISMDVNLVDKKAVTDIYQRQQTNKLAIDARLNALRNMPTQSPEADALKAERDKLQDQHNKNKDKLADMVTEYLDAQPARSQQSFVMHGGAQATTTAVQQIVTTQATQENTPTPPGQSFQSSYSGNVSMVIGQGWAISNGVANADENTYLNYDFRNGLNMPLLLSGAVLNPQIETGTANHFNSGRFSTLDDTHYGNFAYSAWGMWQSTGLTRPSVVDNGNTYSINRVYWTLGPQFARNELPASGYAFYNGPAIGDLHSGGQIMVGELVGDIGINVSLGDLAVEGMLSLYRQTTMAAWGSFSFNGPLEWPADAENLGFGHGSATMSGTGVIGSEIYGSFQGPDGTVRTPPEVSGGWELQKSNGEFGAGVWRAKEAESWTMTAAHLSDSGRNNFSGVHSATPLRNGVNAILKLSDDGPSGMNTYVSPEFTTGAHNHSHTNRFAELNDSAYANFQYVQWGDWSGSGPILTQRDGHVSPISHIFWVGGTPSTPPRTGSATYSGPAIGDLQLNGTTHVRDLAGVITLGVNFATDSMTTNLLLNRVSTNTQWANVSGTAQIMRQDGSHFDTNLPSLSNVPLYVDGDFHGPASGGTPPEAAGVWNVSNGVNGTGIGIFRAKKQ